MSNIGGVHSVGSTPPVRPESSARCVKAENPKSSEDTVEISLQARIANRLAEIPPVRTELVARIKAEIAAGTYETSEKLDTAIDRLMEEL